MVGTEGQNERIRRLADDLRAKILAEAETLSRVRGKITIECYPKGDRYDIDLTTKINLN